MSLHNAIIVIEFDDETNHIDIRTSKSDHIVVNELHDNVIESLKNLILVESDNKQLIN